MPKSPEEPPKKAKLQSIQMLRAVAVLSVLLFHITGLSTEYIGGRFFCPLSYNFKAGVDLFFVISGVVMVITTWKNFGLPTTAPRFFIHRFSRIYPPYWLLTLAVMCFWLQDRGGVNSHSGVNLLSSYTLFPNHALPLVPVAWTLSFELMFYVVFGILLTFASREKFPLYLAVWALVVLAGNGFGLTAEHATAAFLLSPFVLEFIAGCVIGVLYVRQRMNTMGGWAIALACLVAVADIVYQQLRQKSDLSPDPVGLRCLMYGPAAALIVYGFMSIDSKLTKFPGRALLLKCGEASYSIYLVHILVLHFIYRHFGRKAGTAGGAALLFIALFFFALALPFLYFKFVETPLSKLTQSKLEALLPRRNAPAKVLAN